MTLEAPYVFYRPAIRVSFNSSFLMFFSSYGPPDNFFALHVKFHGADLALCPLPSAVTIFGDRLGPGASILIHVFSSPLLTRRSSLTSLLFRQVRLKSLFRRPSTHGHPFVHSHASVLGPSPLPSLSFQIKPLPSDGVPSPRVGDLSKGPF